MRYKGLVLLFFLLSLTAKADLYEEYIERFSEVATEEQDAYGIPASITLAQGILESSAGRSALAVKGNNHFGIKCHKDWEGRTMRQDDDAPNECFRVYSSPEESYRDHSLFLKRERYRPLFKLDITDYKSWANGLKTLGYATDPNYADRLITIIERYSLYTFDTPEGRGVDETAAFIRDALGATHPVRKSNGLHFVVALPGDTYESIAKELGMSKKKLMKYNDADSKTQISAWEEVYLEEKNELPPEGIDTATLGENETLRDVAQRYGMQLNKIKSLNKSVKKRPGALLRLR